MRNIHSHQYNKGAIYTEESFQAQLGLSTRGRPGMDVSRDQLSSGIGLSMARIALYVTCQPELRAAVWRHSKQMTCLQQ